MKKTILTTIFLTLAAGLAAGVLIAQDAQLKVSTSEAMKAVRSKVQPAYPDMAKQLRLEGSVEVEAHISEEGTVESVKPLTGNAVLMSAAVSAMKLWKFTPFTEGGKPVKAVAPISFSFKL